ncbi:hypothetical protein QJQ45_012879 [Haematococcus lacustris]|nr:hypothetical protein QJQ45_012879 [Haematococcus lacustris]
MCTCAARWGVMDMLRFHKFTIGHAWTTDYGCADNARDLEFLLPYSPLHNVCTPLVSRGLMGPPGLRAAAVSIRRCSLRRGDHDDRVVPLHSHKLIATLQHNLVVSQPETTPQRNPLLIRVEVGASRNASSVLGFDHASGYGRILTCLRRWLDRDCNAALNMQRIGESRWRPLELCYWPQQGALPAKGKEYPGLGYKRLRDKPPKAQQQQPAAAQ